MRIPIRWLCEFVPTKKSPEAIADLFVSHGIPVEAISRVGGQLEGLIVQEISENNQKIKVAFNPKTNKSVSKRAIGLDEDGLIILPRRFKNGAPVLDYLDDYVLDFETVPNRGDLTSVIGLARELAAYLSRKPKIQIPLRRTKFKISRSGPKFTLKIIDREGCPDYIARIIVDVTVKPSPFFLQWRLLTCGFRPVNNIVDVTNYLLLKYGQPLHAFDYDALTGQMIKVRRAIKGEKILTIDGVNRELDESFLIIADKARPVALAGIIGGADSEIKPYTKRVLLECARFNPAIIRRGAQKLGIKTEASRRFELGVDQENLSRVAWEASVLISDLALGKIVPRKIESRRPLKSHKISFKPEKINQLLGIEIPKPEMKKILSALGFTPITGTRESWQMPIPTYRKDIENDADLAEDVGRMFGYDKLPKDFLLRGQRIGSKNPLSRSLDKIRDFLTGYGFAEVYTVSFIDEMAVERFTLEPERIIKIPNPLNVRFSVMRPLLLPNLLETTIANFRKGNKELRLFEIGKVYYLSNKKFLETYHLCAILTGQAFPLFWDGKASSVNFYDIKGLVESFFSYLKIPVTLNDSKAVTAYQFLSPQSTEIRTDSQTFGAFGLVKKELLDSLDIKDAVYAWELDLSFLSDPSLFRHQFTELPKYPSIVRDFAFVINDKIRAQEIELLIKESGGEFLERLEIFDCYKGHPLPKDKKNLGIRLGFRSSERTLREEEVSEAVSNILEILKVRLGAELRSG